MFSCFVSKTDRKRMNYTTPLVHGAYRERKEQNVIQNIRNRICYINDDDFVIWPHRKINTPLFTETSSECQSRSLRAPTHRARNTTLGQANFHLGRCNTFSPHGACRVRGKTGEKSWFRSRSVLALRPLVCVSVSGFRTNPLHRWVV